MVPLQAPSLAVLKGPATAAPRLPSALMAYRVTEAPPTGPLVTEPPTEVVVVPPPVEEEEPPPPPQPLTAAASSRAKRGLGVRGMRIMTDLRDGEWDGPSCTGEGGEDTPRTGGECATSQSDLKEAPIDAAFL